MCIFGVGKESDGPRLPLFYLGEGVHRGVLVAFDTPLHELGDLLSRKFHMVEFLYIKCKFNNIISITVITEVIFTYFFR